MIALFKNTVNSTGFENNGSAVRVGQNSRESSTTCRPGDDVLVVWKLDRFAQSLALLKAKPAEMQDFPAGFPIGSYCEHKPLLASMRR